MANLKRILENDKPSKIANFREEYLKKGFELIDITQLCEFKLGRSGCCNGINEPNEEIYHIQIHYRDQPIANVGENGMEVLDDDKYVIFGTERWKPDKTNDFIVFYKSKFNKSKKK
jgi:hypothetical protein